MPGLTVGRYTIAESDLTWRFSRSSGPGGQGVNTSDSRVELTYDVAAGSAFPDWVRARAVRRLDTRLVEGRLTVVASENRSQLRNREAALARLQALLVDAIAPPPPTRRPIRPTRAARERRLDSKKARGQIKRLRRDLGD